MPPASPWVTHLASDVPSIRALASPAPAHVQCSLHQAPTPPEDVITVYGPVPTALPREGKRRRRIWPPVPRAPTLTPSVLPEVFTVGDRRGGSWVQLGQKCWFLSPGDAALTPVFVLVLQIECCLLCVAIGTVTIFCAEIILETPTLDFGTERKPKPLEVGGEHEKPFFDLICSKNFTAASQRAPCPSPESGQHGK